MGSHEATAAGIYNMFQREAYSAAPRYSRLVSGEGDYIKRHINYLFLGYETDPHSILE